MDEDSLDIVLANDSFADCVKSDMKIAGNEIRKKDIINDCSADSCS